MMKTRKENLTMRRLETTHAAQYNALCRYVFQVTQKDLTSAGWQERELGRAKFHTFESANIWGWFEGESLVSQVAVYPLKVRIFGKTFELGGLTSVGTYPEYSNFGLMHDLLQKALQEMRAAGQYISYLFPYSIPYYRRKGWELVSNKITYEIQDYQLPKNRPMPGMVKRVQTNSDDLKNAYRRFAMETHGAILRGDLAWNEYWLWDGTDMAAAVYLSESGEADGFLIYSIARDVFHIKDMGFLNETARHALWNFVSAHFSMIDRVKGTTFTDESLSFLFEDASIQEMISPYYMARIVDFAAFVAQYPFKADTMDRQWQFMLHDPIMPCNDGAFTLKINQNGKAEVIKENTEFPDSIDIQTMATMLMGYKRPEYLAHIGRLKTNGTIIDMLEDAIEQQTPYISDYF